MFVVPNACSGRLMVYSSSLRGKLMPFWIRPRLGVPTLSAPERIATSGSAGAPVVPFIMRGLETLVPGLSKPPRTGVVRVDILAPISTDGWDRKSLESHVDEVRQVFLQYLPDATAN